jgi:hypothetical protein
MKLLCTPKLCHWLASIAMLVLGVAALAKLSDIDAFRHSLVSWQLIPESLKDGLAVAVPAVELGLCAAWFSCVAESGAVVGAFALFVLYTIAYTAHVVLLEAPECDCLGKWEAFHDERFAAALVITRNAALVLLCVPRIRLRPTQGTGRP